MTGTGNKTRPLVTASIFTTTALGTRVSGSTTTSTATELRPGSMAASIRATTKRARKTARANTHGKTAVTILETGLITR